MPAQAGPPAAGAGSRLEGEGHDSQWTACYQRQARPTHLDRRGPLGALHGQSSQSSSLAYVQKVRSANTGRPLKGKHKPQLQSCGRRVYSPSAGMVFGLAVCGVAAALTSRLSRVPPCRRVAADRRRPTGEQLSVTAGQMLRLFRTMQECARRTQASLAFSAFP